MPGLTLDTNSITFPVLYPGQPAMNQNIGITNDGDQPVTGITVEVQEAAGSSGFGAEIIAQTLGLNHTQTTTVVQQPVTVDPPAKHSSILTSHSIQVSFTAPQTPVPGNFTATLVVSWDGGSAQIPLSGSTASLAIDVSSPQPTKITAGTPTTVNFEFTYRSLDATTLTATIVPFDEGFPTGLTFQPANVTMPAQFIEKGQGKPTLPFTNPTGPTNLVPVLATTRTATVPVTVSSNAITAQLGDSTGQALIVVHQPDLTAEGAFYANIAFLVNPPLIQITVSPTPPITLKPTVASAVTLTISAAGAATTLQFDTGSLPAGIALRWPSSAANGQIGIGQSSPVTEQFTLTAPFETTSTTNQDVTLALKWTAYNGIAVGIVDIPAVVLASVKPPPPPPPPSPTIIWQNGKVYGSGWIDPAHASVSITSGQGASFAGPWHGSLVTGIEIQSPCTGNPGEYFVIQVSTDDGKQSATKQINC
jgi:hypothetical protein